MRWVDPETAAGLLSYPHDVELVHAALERAVNRDRFPGLAGSWVRLDGPAGTQMVDTAIEAMAAFMRSGDNANHGGVFAAAHATDACVERARASVARLLGAEPAGVAFGPSMTAMTMRLSAAVGRTLGPGDEVVVTRLDHDANVRPWVIAAERAGATVRWAEPDRDTLALPASAIEAVLSDRTRWVAVTAASNADGHGAGARRDRGRRARGRRAGLDRRGRRLAAPRALAARSARTRSSAPPTSGTARTSGSSAPRPRCWRSCGRTSSIVSPDEAPDRFELGTLPFESLAGVAAAADYLLEVGFDAIRAHEEALMADALEGLRGIDGVTLYGDPPDRVPTLMFNVDGLTSARGGDRARGARDRRVGRQLLRLRARALPRAGPRRRRPRRVRALQRRGGRNPSRAGRRRDRCGTPGRAGRARPRRRRPERAGRAPLRPDGGLVARGARRRGLGDRLPQRGVLRAAGGPSATSPTCGSRTGSSPRAGTGSAGACGATTRSPSTARSGVHRFLRSPRLTLTHEQLLEGGARLLGDWFARRVGDPERRGWGVAFSEPAARAAYVPEDRLRDAALGRLSAPGAPEEQRHWSTYPAVALPSADAAIATLSDTSRWPDFGCAGGRFTALRSGGLEGQTFEIEVVAHPAPRTPVFTRGYVTATGLHTEPDAILERARARGAGRARAAGGRDAAAPARAHDPRGPLPRPRRLPARRLGGGRRRVHPRRRRVGPAPGAPGRPVPARGPGGAGGVLGRRAAGGSRCSTSWRGGRRTNVNPGWVGERVRTPRSAAPAGSTATFAVRNPTPTAHSVAPGGRRATLATDPPPYPAAVDVAAAGRPRRQARRRARSGSCITTTALSTSPAPSQLHPGERLAEGRRGEADGDDRLERGEDRRRRGADALEPREERDHRGHRGDQRDRGRASPSPRPRRRAPGRPSGSETSRKVTVAPVQTSAESASGGVPASTRSPTRMYVV